MSQPRPLVDRTPAVALLKWQGISAVALTLAAWPFGPMAAVSVAVGASIAIAGSLYFALRVFWHDGRSPQKFVQGFYRGEAGKFALTVLLLALAFKGIPSLLAGWLLTGFILEQFVPWFVPLWQARRR